jgi:hypothetical protein
VLRKKRKSSNKNHIFFPLSDAAAASSPSASSAPAAALPLLLLPGPLGREADLTTDWGAPPPAAAAEQGEVPEVVELSSTPSTREEVEHGHVAPLRRPQVRVLHHPLVEGIRHIFYLLLPHASPPPLDPCVSSVYLSPVDCNIHFRRFVLDRSAVVHLDLELINHGTLDGGTWPFMKQTSVMSFVFSASIHQLECLCLAKVIKSVLAAATATRASHSYPDSIVFSGLPCP